MTQSKITLREDIYQNYHPYVLKRLNQVSRNTEEPIGITLDEQRAAFMFAHHSVQGRRVLDIGANQGYLSVEAALRGAAQVDAFESNEVDGTFLSQTAKHISGLEKMRVHPVGYNFDQPNNKQWDCVICLNVLHHIGRYFDTHIQDMDEAKVLMGQHLKRLLSTGGSVWLQLGYNWKGDTQRPMFLHGTKYEMTDFVHNMVEKYADVSIIGLYNPNANKYERFEKIVTSHTLWSRIESLGEFGNRPLYLIKSKRL